MDLVGVAEDVLVGTSRWESTTTTLVVGRRSGAQRAALLVDPSRALDELASLAAGVEVRGIRIVAGFATHAHHDHVLWHPSFGDVPRWATAAAAQVARRERERLLDGVSDDARRLDEQLDGHDGWPGSVLDLVGRVTAIPAGEQGIPDPEGLLPRTAVIEHAGHAPGHGALWLPDHRVLLAGDMLSDVELPLPFDEVSGRGDVATYLAGLDRLTPVVGRAAVLVPGHGTPTRDPLGRLDADRRYLDAVLGGTGTDDPRLAAPGMAAVHERLCRVVSGDVAGEGVAG